MFKIAILVSGAHGRGSTIQNLADACEDGRLPIAKIVRVVGTIADTPALIRAADRGLDVTVVAPKPAETYATRLLHALQDASVDAVCLAGFMRLVPSEVIAAFQGRILNIHPALLPSFGGKGMYGHYVHEAVVEYGVKVTGCTVHFVDGEYDNGPIVLQRPVPVRDDDTAESIGVRVLVAEHAAYPEAVRMLAEGRLKIKGRRVIIAEQRHKAEIAKRG